MRVEEYDDGYDSRISFERAEEDQPEDCERPDEPPSMADPVRDAAHDLLAALQLLYDTSPDSSTYLYARSKAARAIAAATRGQHRPEDQPAPTFVSARESAIDEQAALYDDPYAWEDC